MQTFSILSNYTHSSQKNTFFGVLLIAFFFTFIFEQNATAQLPDGFDPLEQARVVKRIDIRQIPADGIIRLTDENCILGAHVAGVRLVYARNDHQSLQGQDWATSLNYTLLTPQNLDDLNAVSVPLETGIDLAIGEQTAAPYLQTFIAAKTHTLDYSALTYNHNDAEIQIKINGLPVLVDAPDAIWLELELYETSKLPFNPTQNNYHFLAREANTDIVVAWDYVETAYEYELEWVWIDNAETIQENPDSNFDENWITTDPEKIFEYREGVTVQTTNQHFIFPNTFLQGRVFYRLRAIGRFVPENVPNYGDWNYGYDKVTHTKQQALVEIATDYETTHNWQSVTSFAENAKYKTVVSYHDGTGRNRQVVTHLSSEKRTLIAETLYDYEGNPTVNILPVSLEGTNLSYHENLNPFVGSNPFSKDNYDNGSTSTALSTSSGTAQYYSANNTSGGRYAERLPDAQGFAYSRTTYLRDGTGRVREQGGLGATYQVGSAHSTKMFYGSTNDTELKRLFGSNVGKASFYRKQITQDPNGQLSVSYLDAAGQVIATALTGEVPDNVLALEIDNRRTIDVDLKENNIKDELNRRSLSENTIFNNIPGTEYNFTYSVDGKVSRFLENTPLEKCLSCQYELSISIYDENGMGMEFKNPTTGVTFATGLFTHTIDPASCSLENYDINFKVELPEIGTYQVRKELKVISNEQMEQEINEIIATFETQTIEKYREEILATNPCDICFTCITDENALGLLEGGDCESILTQIENAVAEDPITYPRLESHPEYCHYEACVEMSNSKVFHWTMSGLKDWTEAITEYGLPNNFPTDERQELKDFIDQDPLFILYPANPAIPSYPYRDRLVEKLMALKKLDGTDLEDNNTNPISIWNFIDPSITPATHAQLFFSGENMPYQGVDMTDNAAVEQRKWDLFQTRYGYEYELIKKEILENQNFAPNDAPCPYLADQENAIVKDPTLKLEGDRTNFENEVNAAALPNCDMQVEIWLGQLQNACTDPTVDWNTIETKLRSYCDDINPVENPLHVLLATDLRVMEIHAILINASCATEVEPTLATLFQEPMCTSGETVVANPVQMTINKPNFDQQDITIQFDNKGLIGGLVRIGDIAIRGQSNTAQGRWGIQVDVKNESFYQDVYGNWELGPPMPWAAHAYSGQCFLYTLTIDHTVLNATQTERRIKLYINEHLAKEIVITVANTDLINHNNKVIVGQFDLNNDWQPLSGGNSISDLKVWTGIRSHDQIKLDRAIPVTNPVLNTLNPLAHWTLKGGDTQDLVNTAGDPTNNGDVEAMPLTLVLTNSTTVYPRTLIWKEFCCQNTPDPYAPEIITIADEKQDCIDRFEEIAKKDAQIIIDRKRNELRAELIAKYNQDCLDTQETFKYTYTTAEHHYTLYYYDQAGNLVQTVSPQGVITDGNDNHNLETKYKYNSLNAPIDQETPDAGKSEFFYDKVARIRLSQNAQQKADQNYSYTKYDAQGRITEVGQLEGKQDATPLDINALELELDNIDFPSQTDYILTQITRTFYDDQATGTPTQITPKNLRGRIAAVKVFEDGQTQGAATFYDYDIHGNVEKLVQSLPELEPKTVEYSYDLLSGNVHRVTYQKGRLDQFMHRYTYDADNRLEAVFTSSDGYIWDEDARYLYYAHGPMARVELGEYKVQGVDYYYTLQGWIKGVNLQGDHDAEATNNVQKYVSKDAFGYALHYYQNDYTSITGNFGWNGTGGYDDLFNGNIAAMSTTLKTSGENVMLYSYDQLNRIANSICDYSFGFEYETDYKYDANGNILDLERWNADGARIDKINYTYNITQNNRLQSVNDVSTNNEGLESGNHSYTYDEIGNLSSDKDIESIQWTVYGKIAKVKKRDLTEIDYKYDGTGQRIYKKVATTTVTKETHYVRDGSGNVLAIYENKVIDELVIYGSSRLGSYNAKTDQGKRTLGNKKYELSNHLGNVLAVISDNKIGIGTNGVADYYEPLVISESDYYPFGMAMKERSFSNEEYRFGFNGMEKDGDLGEGNMDYDIRIYDSKISRFKSVDPMGKSFPSTSPFSFATNNPILYYDDGNRNIIYLAVVYTNGKPEIDIKTANQIAEKANQFYKQMGLETRVVVYDEKERGAPINSDFIDATDNISFIGTNRKNIIKQSEESTDVPEYWINSVRKREYDNKENEGTIAEISLNPESPKSDGYNVGILIDYDEIPQMILAFVNRNKNGGNISPHNIDKDECVIIGYTALTLVHGSGHCAGLNHETDIMDDRGQGLNLDYLPKGGNPDSFATMTEKQLKKMKSRYGTKRAQDNYNSNKKQYETFAKKCGKQFAKIAYKIWKKTRR